MINRLKKKKNTGTQGEVGGEEWEIEFKWTGIRKYGKIDDCYVWSKGRIKAKEKRKKGGKGDEIDKLAQCE